MNQMGGQSGAHGVRVEWGDPRIRLTREDGLGVGKSESTEGSKEEV
jgi:hypothetical protein